MTTSVTELASRRDVPLLTPRLGQIHQTCTFIAQQQLALGDVLFLDSGDTLIDLTRQPHSHGALRRWALALDAPIVVTAQTVQAGRLMLDLTVQGLTPAGAFVKVIARRPVLDAR